MISKPRQNFMLLAFVAAALSVLTTIGIHSPLFDLGPLDFDERLHLADNPTYIANRFWVIFHCLFVLISMWAICLRRIGNSPGFIGLGFVFYSAFAFSEIFRQMYVLFYLNNLRRAYATAESSEQAYLAMQMDSTGLFGLAIFGFFIVAFGLGNIFYGMGLFGDRLRDRLLGAVLCLWGIMNLLVFSNEFFLSRTINTAVEYFSLIYQPLARAGVACWLWLEYKELER